MMFVPFIILFSISGILCDPFDCVRKERKTCGEFPLIKSYPESAEELRTACNNFDTFGRCMINVHEACGYNEERLNEMRKIMSIINSACDEDGPAYKVISNNIECIGPVARKLDYTCNQWEMSEDNFNLAAKHEMEISNNYTREDMEECLVPFWQVSCGTIVMGLRCGSEVKEVVHDILTKIDDRYEKCTSEILEELQPLYETFEFIIEAELKLKNALKKRK